MSRIEWLNNNVFTYRKTVYKDTANYPFRILHPWVLSAYNCKLKIHPEKDTKTEQSFRCDTANCFSNYIFKLLVFSYFPSRFLFTITSEIVEHINVTIEMSISFFVSQPFFSQKSVPVSLFKAQWFGFTIIFISWQGFV